MADSQSIKPSFFIVGAPKCGTTSLYETFRSHPDLFLPFSETNYWKYKEPYFFCEELIAWDGLRIQDEESYLNLFSEAHTAQLAGEATALYLYSKKTPQRIKQFAPDAKIIILLRHPVDMMVSWHHDCVRWGHENVIDFEEAVLLEAERKKGQKMPPGSGYPSCLIYSEIADFAPQVSRYFDTFGRENVGVWLLDDLKGNPTHTLAQIQEFLGLDAAFPPQFHQHNKRKALSRADLINMRVKTFMREHAAWAKHVKPLIPSILTELLGKGIRRMDKPVEKPTIKPELLNTLRNTMQERIVALEELLQRDLSSWKVQDTSTQPA